MYDMHTHTGFSDDCDYSAEEMLSAAAQTGLSGIAVTDHYDPGYPDPEFPFIIDFEKYNMYLDAVAEEYAGRLDIIRGLEVGIMDTQLENAKKAVAAYDYDFIIGSFHCLRQYDLCTIDYPSYDGPSLMKDFYEYMYEMLRVYKSYDVLGHLSIIDRYIGGIYDLDPCMEIIREIMKMIIDDGKGIEINTSNFKYDMSVWLPRTELLATYRELGGEILTIGSDSHEPYRFGDHFDEASELARSLGFKYCCSYHQRKPEFHKL